jgi:hypothetical protein
MKTLPEETINKDTFCGLFSKQNRKDELIIIMDNAKKGFHVFNFTARIR